MKTIKICAGISIVIGMSLLFPAGCGDFCLFGDCDGDGNNNDDNGNGSQKVCDIPFTKDVQKFVVPDRLDQQDTLGNPIAVAVVPAGMSFKVGIRTVDPGDVLVADQTQGRIYVYQFGQTDRIQMVTNVSRPSGLALLHWKGDVTGDQEEEEFNLLFYTSASTNALYMYALDNTYYLENLPLNPFPITNTILGVYLLEPTSVAVGVSEEKVSIFILNNNNGGAQSIVRFSVDLKNLTPTGPKVLASGFAELKDLAYRSSGDELFFSQKDPINPGLGRVLYIDNAAADIPSNPAGYITQLTDPYGLAIPFTSTTGEQSALLMAEQEFQPQLLQFDFTSGLFTGLDLSNVGGFVLDMPTALAYDCAHQRIVFSNIPQNPDLSRSLLSMTK